MICWVYRLHFSCRTLLHVACCTLRVARCVLHVACCTLHVACYMLPCCALQVMARTDLRGLPAGFEMPVYLIEEGRCFGELNVLGLISKHAAEPTPLPPHRAGSAGLRCLRFLPPARYCEYQAWHTHARERTHAHTRARADTHTRRHAHTFRYSITVSTMSRIEYYQLSRVRR